MRKQKPLRPYERPMALRRSFFVVVLIVGGLYLVRALTSQPVPPLGKLSPQQLATSMEKALLHVHDMTFTVANQIESNGITDAVGGSLSVERNGNFQISGQSEQDPALTGEIRNVDGTLYFRYSKSVIYRIMRLVPQRVSNDEARAAAVALGGRWFTTGDTVTTSGDAPPAPTSVHAFFSSLGIRSTKYVKQVPTTNQGVTVVPLVSGDVTWFVRANGARLPNAIASYSFAANANPIGFLADSPTIQVSYGHVAITTPTHLAAVPDGFGAQWNIVLPAQRISSLTPYGLLWLALAPHS